MPYCDQVLKAQGVLIESIRVTPVDALDAAAPAKPPLILGQTRAHVDEAPRTRYCSRVLRNRPVCDDLHAAIFSGVPVTTTSPPA